MVLANDKVSTEGRLIGLLPLARSVGDLVCHDWVSMKGTDGFLISSWGSVFSVILIPPMNHVAHQPAGLVSSRSGKGRKMAQNADLGAELSGLGPGLQHSLLVDSEDSPLPL